MLIIFLCLTLFLPDSPNQREAAADCNLEISYSTEVTASQKTKIVVSVKGGKRPYHYFFLDAKKNPLVWEFESNSLIVEKNAVPKTIKVLDSDGCYKIVDFNESLTK